MSKCVLFALIAILFSGCYAMPGENDYSVIPATNNPSVTCDKGQSLIPGMGM